MTRWTSAKESEVDDYEVGGGDVEGTYLQSELAKLCTERK